MQRHFGHVSRWTLYSQRCWDAEFIREPCSEVHSAICALFCALFKAYRIETPAEQLCHVFGNDQPGF